MSSCSKYSDGGSSAPEDIASRYFDEYRSHLDIPFGEIVRATNNFADENLLKKGTSFWVYKGQLLQSGGFIDIVARGAKRNGVAHNEMEVTKNLKHENIASLFKTSFVRRYIMINKLEVNASLDKHLNDQTLTWMQRLHICVGVARALSYLHYDSDDHYVIHGNIKSSKILLDHNWEPKLHGFGFSARAKKHHPHLTGKYNRALQYMDPAYEDTGGLTHKSDVFSFGVLLFEVLFGREASIQNNDKWYFARLARSHYEERKLDDLIAPDLRKKMNLQSFNIFAETAYCCLKEKRSQRPNMNQILVRLERALELQHKHEHSTVAGEGTSSNHLKGGNLDHLKFRLSDIELATNKFSKKYCIGSGGYGMVYKAELEHFDGINSLVVEGNVKGELSKKCSTVAIKRIFSREDEQGKQGFVAEIEMLSNCKHPNIVSLLGFCDEGPEMLLVYEYASNGSLDDYLGNIDNMTTLTWAQRIQICVDIAQGLNYLHRSTEGKQIIIHRDIKSANILLDDHWVAKIADFGLSKLHPACQQGSTLITYNVAGTDVYLDPEYLKTGRLKTKSDIYSFGVVMFEIMCGKLAYDKTYNEEGLPSVARHCFKEGTLEKLVDPNLKETDEIISMLNGGVNQDSLDTFSKIAYQCLAVTQSERPTLEVVINELEKALYFQENNKDSLHISLETIKSITQNFSNCNCIGEGRHWRLYKGEFVNANGCTTVVTKRWDSKSSHGHVQFYTELEILKYKHENIIGLVGYCNEMNEKIIVYEHASNGSLDQHLNDPILTWIKRLKIGIGIANGLLYLHGGGGGKLKDSMKHRDIKSGSILLDDSWNAKISNLELSQKRTIYDTAEHVYGNVCDSLGYIDPDYNNLGYLTEDSDTYSLGVILLEMLCGRLAWKEGCRDHSRSLASLAMRHYGKYSNLDEMIFYDIKEDIVPQSLAKFQLTAIKCVLAGRYRPRMNEVVRRLTEALELQEDYEAWEHRVLIDYKETTQSPILEKYDGTMKKVLYDMFSRGIFLQDDGVENNKDSLHISLKAIKSSTQNFSECKVIGEGRFWKLYEGELLHANGCTTIVAKRWNTESRQRDIQFITELEILYILLKYNHENIIGLVGFCIELEEKIIVYEDVSNGSLSRYLGYPGLTWMKRLKICIDVANGLGFLHFGGLEQEFLIIHRDIKSDNILLDGDWNAKISNLQFSRKTRVVGRAEHVDDKTCDSLGYVDPGYQSDGILTKKWDIYSLGVFLLEMLCGRLAWSEGCVDYSKSLGPLAIRHYNEKGNLDEIIFQGIKEQIAPQSLTTFLTIAIQCLHDNMYERPWTNDIIIQLKKALEFQKDYEIWEPKLPIDYKEIILMSKAPEIYDNKMKKDMLDMFSKGILLQDGKVWFSLGSNGERKEIISAKRFSYKNQLLPKWRSLPESRFPKVAEMFHISNLNIQIKLRTQFLTPSVYYKVHLIFRFCGPRKSKARRIYLDLKYKMGNETLHAYFATWREDGWMMIELFQFLNHKKDTDFEVLLESFSRCYCGSDSIYIEGIQFQGFDDVNEEMQKLEDDQHLFRSKSKTHKFWFSPSKMKVKKDHMTWFSLCEIKRKKDAILSAKKVVYNSSNVAIPSRFSGAIEFQRQQVLHIKCKIKSQMLSPNTENACYLVFKLSEKFCELHGPVIVRDLFNWRSKETGILYFRYPNIWNIHDSDWVPKKRKDGWMEVVIWKFNSNYVLKNDLFVSLKLITYEGTMSGLIVRGITFRPI